MTEENMQALLDHFRAEAREQRHERIIRHLDKLGGLPAEHLENIDSDLKWFRVWTGALGYGATCPSQALRQQVRDTIRGRFTELHALTFEERDMLEQMERAREQATGQQAYEPDLETDEDGLDR